MKKFTAVTIVFGGESETWKVPRGFGAEYKREAARQFERIATHKPGEIIDLVIDFMSLIGYEPTRDAVAGWNLRKRVEAVVYSANVHARASDNPIRRHPDLPWLRDLKPWRGPPVKRRAHIRSDLWGAFEGLAPTPVLS